MISLLLAQVVATDNGVALTFILAFMQAVAVNMALSLSQCCRLIASSDFVWAPHCGKHAAAWKQMNVTLCVHYVALEDTP